MKTSTKVIIDKYAGGFIVYLLKQLTAHFLSEKKKPAGLPGSIVICKFLGMGSIIQSTPLLQTLKKQNPEVRIIYLSSLSNKKLLQQITLIDELILLDDTSLYSTIISTISSIKSLISKKADVFIDLEMYSHFSKIFTLLSRASLKFGLKNSSAKGSNVYTSVFELYKDRPVSESYLEICKVFSSVSPVHELYQFSENEKMFRKTREQFKISGQYIIVNPNASDLRIERRWPKEKFSELIAKLTGNFPDYKIILIGSKAESEYVKGVWSEIKENTNGKIIDTSGLLSIEELISLISQAELIITNDTGPMHLAFAAHRPTIALFGPASPEQFGNHRAVTAIYKKVACSPCVHDHIKPPCNGDNSCMKQIEVREVFEVIEKKLVSRIQI